MAFTSTYNFVPLNPQVFYPSWADQVSQDAPFSDGEDGVIDVTFHNVSPLFIRNGSTDRNNKEPYSAHIMIGGKRLYFLPGSSIKGMLRSTMEIMSFGKLGKSQFTDRFFSKRELGGKLTPDGQKYVEMMKGVRPAWLRKKGEKLFLTPCDGEWKRIDDKVLRGLYPSFAKAKKTRYDKNAAIAHDANEWYPTYNLDGDDYHIVCTGNIDKKVKDYLFPIGRLEEVEVMDERVRTAFYTVHEPTPDFDKIVQRLDAGQDVAVFYLPGHDTYDIKAIGISAMLRYPYKQSVSDLIKAEQAPKEDLHDLTETIFGYTTKGDKDSLRGRVQIGNAFIAKPLADDQLGVQVSGVQGQPKASFYPFYLKQRGNPYKTYDTADGIAGRKLYRVHRGSTVTDLPKGNGNENALTHFIPIPAGQTFHLKIAVHNLRKMETGALLSALTLHQTKGAWHNLGLAKGFGYGKLEIDSISLSNGFAGTVDDYLKAFESQMSVFTYTTSKVMWAATPQVTALMGILGEHDDADLRVMQLNAVIDGKKTKEYVEAKRHFSKLTEKAVPVNSFLSDTDKEKVKDASFAYQKEMQRQAMAERKRKWRLERMEAYSKAEALRNQGKYDEAMGTYHAIIRELSIMGQDTSEEYALLHEVEKEKADLIQRQQQQADEEREKQKQQKLSAGIAAMLDEVFPPESPNAGQYKTKDFKLLFKKTEQWMKKANEKELSDVEKESLAASFHRIYAEEIKNKKTAKDLSKKDSKTWQKAKAFLGSRFGELMGDLYD